MLFDLTVNFLFSFALTISLQFLTDDLVVPSITVVPFVRALSKFLREKIIDKWTGAIVFVDVGRHDADMPLT